MPHIFLTVRKGSDGDGGQLAVLAVIKTDHRYFLGNINLVFYQGSNQLIGNFIIVADHCRAGRQSVPLDDRGSGQGMREDRTFVFGVVPEYQTVIHGDVCFPQGGGVTGVTAGALDVVGFEDAGDPGVAFADKVFRQLFAAAEVVVQHGQGTVKLGVVAMDKHQGDSFIHNFLIQIQIGVGKRGFGSFHQNSVYRQVQQVLQYLSFVGYLVLGGKKGRGAIVLGKDILNYTGAVITWLKKDAALLDSDGESERLARLANPADKTYFVPAFTGLGAPYWDSGATGLLTGITRTTGKAEIVKACLESIGYQITDLVLRMAQDAGLALAELRVDGGPTANSYLMQFQSDMARVEVSVPEIQELSGFGAACAAGFACGFYDPAVVHGQMRRHSYLPRMKQAERDARYAGWQSAVRQTLTHD